MLFGCYFFDIYPILINLFANEHKLVLVSGTEVWRLISSSSTTALFLLNPFNIASFCCFWFSKDFWAFVFLFFFHKRSMKKGVGESYTHHNCLLMEKYFLKNAHTCTFWQKDPKGGIFEGFRRQGRRRIWVLIFQHRKQGPIGAHLQKELCSLGQN